MSFYITLPSNASEKDYPNNTKTHFKTKLKNAKYLDGTYEVALVELLYPLSWKYRKDGRINISLEDISIDYTVEFYISESLPELVERMTSEFKLMQIVCTIDYKISAQKIFLFIPENCVFTFYDEIEQVFGFSRSQYIGGKTTREKQFVIPSHKTLNQNASEISNFYIYSDIVDYQIVGDEQTPLLRIVPTGSVSKGINSNSKIFDSPHYLPVSRNNIDTIEIDIRNHFGEPILFTTGEVVVKLHFKRKSYY